MPGYQLCSFQNLTWCELMINKKGRGVPEQLPNACILRFNECPRWVKCVPLYNLQCRWVGVTKMPQCCVPELWLLFCREILTLDCGFVQPTDWVTGRPTDRLTKEVTNHRLCDYTVEDVLMNTTFVKCVVKSKEAFIILIVHLNMKCNVYVYVCVVDHSQVISI